MDDVIQRSENHLDRITTIYTMTAKFYSEKGSSVSNYDTLVANVEIANGVYRDAVKTFVKAVRDVAKTSESTTTDARSGTNAEGVN